MGRNHASAAALTAFIATVDPARSPLSSKTPLDVLSEAFDKLELPRMPTGNPSLDQLKAAVRLALEVARQRGSVAGPEAFTEVVLELEELRQSGGDAEDGVSALTVHRSKGLEFDHVVVMGVQGDVFPNYKFANASPSIMEEERRLFYVALTRTKMSVLLTNHARDGAAGLLPHERDGFITELPQHLTRQT